MDKEKNVYTDDPFTHLHVHTDYSLLDGLGKIDDYIKTGLSLGMKSMAFTDHGTMAGLVSAYDACKKYGMKFIGGFEAYVAPYGHSRFEKKTIDENKAYDHLIILFKNKTGYKNGCTLVTRSNTEGFYYKPRIDFDLLRNHSEGLIIMSACLAGAVPRAILNGDIEKARRIVKDYKDVFGDDYYLEIQDHGFKEDQIVINEILKLSKEFGIKLIATNDCHYVHKDDKEAHDWLLYMQMGKHLGEENKMINDGDYYLKSKEEMLALFPYCPEAIYNTQEIVDKCNFEFEYGNYRMPKVDIPEKYHNDYYKYLEDEAWKGYEKRYPIFLVDGKREKAKSRLEYELGIIKQMNFAQYFLDIRKTIVEARKAGILVGPGRGSGAGSCLNYCLEITDLDPLQYDLLFERFLNPERISMPDIDTDFEFLRKDDVLKEEADDYGYDCFAKIETFGTMKAKNVLKGCAKVSGIENHVVVGNKLAKFILDDKQKLKDAWSQNPELQAYIHSDSRLEKIWEIALKLEGTKKSAGTHACGHIPTPVPCEQLFPCRVDSESGYLVCEYDKDQAEHLGNLKKDLLMLRNLTIIDTAQKEIKRRTGKEIPLWTPEILNDKKALEMIASGDTNGVFQLESDGMKRFMRQLQPDCFEDIIAGVALYRPGPMDYIPDYIRNKHNPSGIKYAAPELKPILESTYGIIVYQEQVMLIVQAIAGFTMGRADLVRKAMGKKKEDIMQQEGLHFIYGDKELGIEGCINHGIPKAVAEDLWGQMEDFGKYAFNKSHAAAYAAISMQTAFLKANYPLEFAVGLLTSVMDDSKKLMKYVSSYRAMGINVLPPDVRKSEYGFSIEEESGKDCIRFGLFALKGVGESIARNIPEERAKETYTDIEDFVTRHLEFNKKAFESLAKSGAFDSFGYTRHTLVDNLGDMLNAMKKQNKNIDKDQLTLFDMGLEKPTNSFMMDELPEYDFLEKCKFEKEATGMYVSGHPASEIKDTARRHGAIEIEDILNENSIYENNSKVCIYGVITEIKRKVTKNGNPMMLLTVEDETDSITVMMFERGIQQYASELQEDSLVFVKGKVRGGGEDSSIILDKVYALKETPSVLWIATNDVSLINIKKLAKDFMKENGGIGDYIYVVSLNDRHPECLGEISITPEVIQKARIKFGNGNVKVTQRKKKTQNITAA